MSSTPQTRIAVAGAGIIGLAHIAVINDSKDCVLSAIVDPSPAAAGVASKVGVPLYKTLEELLAKDQPDGIILATPNHLHVPQALHCIEAGVPILLEKPIATTVQEAHTLVDLVDRTGAKVLIGHHRAHSPIMAKAKQVVESGQLGQLVAVMGSATFVKPDQYFADGPWRREIGGGPILINMIHEVHNLRMLCGDIVAVQAFKSNATRGFAVEDTAAINLRFASGVLGTFMLSDTAACARSWEQTSEENKAYPSYGDEDCYVIAGTMGSLSVPTMRIKTYPRPEERSWWKPFEVGTVGMVREDPLSRQIAHFVQVVRGNAEPLVTARDGLNNLRAGSPSHRRSVRATAASCRRPARWVRGLNELLRHQCSEAADADADHGVFSAGGGSLRPIDDFPGHQHAEGREDLRSPAHPVHHGCEECDACRSRVVRVLGQNSQAQAPGPRRNMDGRRYRTKPTHAGSLVAAPSSRFRSMAACWVTCSS